MNRSLFSVLVRSAPNRVFLSLLLGTVAGLAYSLVIPLILLSLQAPIARLLSARAEPTYIAGYEIATPKFAYVFLAVCLLVLVTRVVAETLLACATTDAMVALRKRMYHSIAYTPIQVLERIGVSRLSAALTTDVPRVVNGAALLPSIFISGATVVGLLGYLVYLNRDIFVFVMGAILVGILTYRLPFFLGDRYYMKSREHFDRLQEGMRGLIHGAKELKLDRLKREAFLEDELHGHEELYGRAQKRGDTLMNFAVSYGDLISFFVIGIVTYALANHHGLTTEHTVGVVMALLYISSPLGVILNAVAPAMKGAVSLRKISELLQELPTERSWQQPGRIDCSVLSLRGLTYRHPAPAHENCGFGVGPIDLELCRGEVTFIVGGNGSGKSTLGKLLSLHYLPDAGNLCFDGKPVTDLNREQCRQSIGAIYSDFHLFSRLFLDPPRLAAAESAIRKYLDDFALADKVTIEAGRFSTLALSDGQRRRLALLVALLDERSIYVFDEWAADQDPQSREAFYGTILPQLRSAGKMVIVISHDERYFHKADRILRMEDGRIVSESGKRMKSAAAP